MEVQLKTGLRRGVIAAVAGDIVEVQDGLGKRLIDRGQAVLVTREDSAENGPEPKPEKASKDKAPKPDKPIATTVSPPAKDEPDPNAKE